MPNQLYINFLPTSSLPVELLNSSCVEYDCKAVRKALEGEAKLKYFQHAGALLTADGTDDDLIKFEGVPADYKIVVPSM